MQCTLATPTVQSQTYGEAAFTALKGEVDRKRQPKLARAACISKETLQLEGWRTELHRAGRASTREVCKARQEYSFIVVYSQDLIILKMAMGSFDKMG